MLSASLLKTQLVTPVWFISGSSVLRAYTCLFSVSLIVLTALFDVGCSRAFGVVSFVPYMYVRWASHVEENATGESQVK